MRGFESHPDLKMEILFLGTSSGWPLPRLGCNCKICESSDPKDTRLRPSILINKTILVDAPPDIYFELKEHKIDPTRITHILITHAHDDHIAGLYDLTHIYNLKNQIKLISPKNVLSQIQKKLGISALSFEKNEALPYQKLSLEPNSYCWFLPVEHTTEAYAIKIMAPKPILYAPEFRKIAPSVAKSFGNLELAILDGSSKTKLGQTKGHETIEEGIKLGKKLKAKKTIFTNIGHKTDTYKDLGSFVKDKGGPNFRVSFDGLKLDF